MAGNATCFDVQGQPGLESANYQACWSGTSDGHSVCCPQGWTCMKNLLCVYEGTSQKGISQGSLQRGLCTDETFKSKNCPQFCLGGDQHHNNGTAIKNCGSGKGCCHNDPSKDCKCSVGSAGALLLEVQSVVSYTNNPSTPVTLWLSGTATSISTPQPAKTTSNSASITTSSTSTKTTLSTSRSSAGTQSSRSDTTLHTPTAHNFVAVSTALPAEATTSSPSMVAASSTSTPNLGLMVGLPIGIIIAVASLIMAFFLFRRHMRQDRAKQYEADILTKRQWPQDRSATEKHEWDYKSVPPSISSPKSRYSICNKPLPTPRASQLVDSAPIIMHELPNDDWLAKELPGSMDSPKQQRYELG